MFENADFVEFEICPNWMSLYSETTTFPADNIIKLFPGSLVLFTILPQITTVFSKKESLFLLGTEPIAIGG